MRRVNSLEGLKFCQFNDTSVSNKISVDVIYV